MRATTIGRKTIKLINAAVNIAAMTIAVLLLALSGYALWDSEQLYQMADKSQYSVYKPTAKNQGKSFKELQAINPDVIAWLTVYGTNVDYPVVQGRDNLHYATTNVEGQYSASGSIFLDYENGSGFGDFANILYGHHMEKSAMFGDVGSFSAKDVFDSHRYGNLYYEGQNHGIEFICFAHTDAFDSSVFTVRVGEAERRAYLDNLFAKSIYTRDAGGAAEDRLVLLSTCSSSSTNGRDILVGRITDAAYENTFDK